MSPAAPEPYGPKVLEHFERPRNAGRLDPDDPRVGTGMVRSPGAEVAVRFQVEVEGGVVTRSRFKTFGCGSAIASTSVATEWLAGRTLDETLALRSADIVRELGLPPAKIHCAVVVVDAIAAAVADYRQKVHFGITRDTDSAEPTASA